MKVVIANIGQVVTGDWREPFDDADTIVTESGKIIYLGSAPGKLADGADVIIDAAGTTVIPGLIDSQVHNTFGDYTPRQKTVGFLESYVHGGTTTAISASEVHVPGPTERSGGRESARRCGAEVLRNLSPRGHACSRWFDHSRTGIDRGGFR
jgi:enamidase